MTSQSLNRPCGVLAAMEEAARKLYVEKDTGAACNALLDAKAKVAELIEAAGNASAILGHAYHTQITGELANDAHDAYQRLDAALAAVEGKA